MNTFAKTLTNKPSLGNRHADSRQMLPRRSSGSQIQGKDLEMINNAGLKCQHPRQLRTKGVLNKAAPPKALEGMLRGGWMSFVKIRIWQRFVFTSELTSDFTCILTSDLTCILTSELHKFSGQRFVFTCELISELTSFVFTGEHFEFTCESATTHTGWCATAFRITAPRSLQSTLLGTFT
ncbi:hypothetical protein ACMD2_24670, partial [Ananas comosus]